MEVFGLGVAVLAIQPGVLAKIEGYVQICRGVTHQLLVLGQLVKGESARTLNVGGRSDERTELDAQIASLCQVVVQSTVDHAGKAQAGGALGQANCRAKLGLNADAGHVSALIVEGEARAVATCLYPVGILVVNGQIGGGGKAVFNVCNGCTAEADDGCSVCNPAAVAEIGVNVTVKCTGLNVQRATVGRGVGGCRVASAAHTDDTADVQMTAGVCINVTRIGTALNRGNLGGVCIEVGVVVAKDTADECAGVADVFKVNINVGGAILDGDCLGVRYQAANGYVSRQGQRNGQRAVCMAVFKGGGGGAQAGIAAEYTRVEHVRHIGLLDVHIGVDGNVLNSRAEHCGREHCCAGSRISALYVCSTRLNSTLQGKIFDGCALRNAKQAGAACLALADVQIGNGISAAVKGSGKALGACRGGVGGIGNRSPFLAAKVDVCNKKEVLVVVARCSGGIVEHFCHVCKLLCSCNTVGVGGSTRTLLESGCDRYAVPAVVRRGVKGQRGGKHGQGEYQRKQECQKLVCFFHNLSSFPWFMPINSGLPSII